jgi:hypothetical protein
MVNMSATEIFSKFHSRENRKYPMVDSLTHILSYANKLEVCVGFRFYGIFLGQHLFSRQDKN